MDTPKVSAFALAGLIAAAASCTAPIDKFCTDVGCSASVTTSRTIVGDVAALEGATVTICRNGDCADATLIPSTLAAGVLVDDFSVNGDTSPRNCVVESAGTDKVSIRLSYRLNADDAPQDGDSYTFQVTPKDSPSTMLVDVQGAVTYAVTQPNGPTCEPTCYNASL